MSVAATPKRVHLEEMAQYHLKSQLILLVVMLWLGMLVWAVLLADQLVDVLALGMEQVLDDQELDDY